MILDPTPGPNRFIRAAVAVGHYYSRAAVPLYAVINVLAIAQWILPRTPIAVTAPLVAGLVALITGSICDFLAHDRYLCPRDVDRAVMLLNPQAAVTAHRRSLRLYHQRWQMLAFILADILTIALYMNPNGGYRLSPAIQAAVVAAALAATAVHAWASHATRIHAALQPWCPWCRRGGGGDDDHAPQPDPVLTADR